MFLLFTVKNLSSTTHSFLADGREPSINTGVLKSFRDITFAITSLFPTSI